MELLARWVSNRIVAWGTVIVVALLSAASLLQIRELTNEDDILAFLPQSNPDVQLFYDINKRFGGLDLALVGIEVDNPFAPEFLSKLQQITEDLRADPRLDHVLSLTNVVDFTPNVDLGGVIAAPLVQHIPRTDAEQAALRKRVMSRDHVVGNLISADGHAVLIYGFLTYGADPKTTADCIRAIVEGALSDATIYWGGGPFVATYIYDTTQKDLRRLTPWAVLAVVVVIMVVFRDWAGALLSLLTTGIAIAYTLGLMATFEVPFNIVLGAMPIILFAIGSAYGIHLLSRYYALAEREDDRAALSGALRGVGPVILAAGLTTVASLLSFVFMDIQPIRTFGLFTATGILAALVLSLTFIPAVVHLTRLKRKRSESIVMRKAMVWLSVFAQTRRRTVGGALLALAALSAFWISRVDTSVDLTTFFSAGSPPDRAERFLGEHFGGGQFIQLFVQGDLTDPHALREMRRVADRVRLHPMVSSVRHVADALALSGQALVGQRRVPDTRAQVRELYSFMLGDPAVAQLVSSDHTQGLVHIQVSSSRAEDLESVLEFTERTLAEELAGRYAVVGPAHPRWPEAVEHTRDVMTRRILALAREFGIELPVGAERKLRVFFAQPVPDPDPAVVEEGLMRFFNSEEYDVELAPLGAQRSDPERRIAETLAGLKGAVSEKELTGRLAELLGQPPDSDRVLDLVWAVATPLEELWRDARAQRRARELILELGLTIPPGGRSERFVAAAQDALWDQDNLSGLVPAAGPQSGKPAPLAAAVEQPGGGRGPSDDEEPSALTTFVLRAQANGLPVLHRGLSRSVEANQLRSIIFAVLVVIVILSLLLRSLFSGLLAASPTLLTLIAIYGGMGALRVHLDIGTSMLASIILGVGVDYAVHLVAGWHPTDGGGLTSAAANAADRSGPAIWTNAVMISLGFFVLTLGEARPLRNVGGLTAAAMLVAALTTFLTIPVLARKLGYRRTPAYQEGPRSSAVVDAVLSKALPTKGQPT